MGRIGRLMVVVLAMTCMSISLKLASAQTKTTVGPCWTEIDTCIERNANQSATNPKFNPKSPMFQPTEFWCCSLIQQTARSNMPCFCTIRDFLHQPGPDSGNQTEVLIFCGAFDKLPTLDAVCTGKQAKSPAIAPHPGSSLSPSPAKSPKASPPSPTSTPAPKPAPTPSPSAPLPAGAPKKSPAPAPAPAPAQESNGVCWQNIGNCINSNIANSKSVPQLNPSSPSFNKTDFFCCPLLQGVAKNDKSCFCLMESIIRQDPNSRNSTGVLTVLNSCGVADSLTSLSSFCAGSSPSQNGSIASPPAPTPANAPMASSPSLAPSPSISTPTEPTSSPTPSLTEAPTTSPATGASPSNDTTPAGGEAKPPSKNGSNKIAMTGSLSGLVVLLTFFIYY